ncbi:hypothetical protein E2C01_052408 [Portunus trituberculatus]|uniref:Uncharacterized protein n=1 Tax=Portunus trituberculatus TaxID=210409 RepID=A0A5B7GLR5_PORTR|nr:hypothetical protein [Portunus trituberculatus]
METRHGTEGVTRSEEILKKKNINSSRLLTLTRLKRSLVGLLCECGGGERQEWRGFLTLQRS